MSGDPVVTQAISNIRARYSDDEWAALLPSEVTSAIYREIRRLDLARLALPAKPRQPAEAAA